MNNIIFFKYKEQEIRIIKDEQNEPWWVAKDVCAILCLGNITEATKRLDDDEKSKDLIPTLGGPQQMLIVNESGLYSLILRSNKPEAKPFKHWVTHEVLPSFRKTESYQIQQDSDNLAQPKKITFAFLAREYNGALRLARSFGLEGNQAVLSANKVIKRQYGPNCMSLMELTHLICEKQEIHLNASDIGKRLGNLSAQQVHKLLEIGLTEPYKDKKNKIH